MQCLSSTGKPLQHACVDISISASYTQSAKQHFSVVNTGVPTLLNYWGIITLKLKHWIFSSLMAVKILLKCALNCPVTRKDLAVTRSWWPSQSPVFSLYPVRYVCTVLLYVPGFWQQSTIKERWIMVSTLTAKQASGCMSFPPFPTARYQSSFSSSVGFVSSIDWKLSLATLLEFLRTLEGAAPSQKSPIPKLG